MEPPTADPPACRLRIPPPYTVTPLSTPPDWTVSVPPDSTNPTVVAENTPLEATVTEPPAQMIGS